MSELNWCRGKFISFEGIEGLGKSTNINFLAEHLKKADIEYIITREPGGTAIGEKLRAILLTQSAEPILPLTELLVVFAARNQHIEHIIKPALAKNICVLCDRFTDATFAYQGGGRNIDKTYIDFLQQIVQDNLRPHLTFLFDAPITVGLERAKNRGDLDRIEAEEAAFFERVRTAYLAQAQNSDHEYQIINADDNLENIQQQIITILNR